MVLYYVIISGKQIDVNLVITEIKWIDLLTIYKEFVAHQSEY